MFDWLRRRIKGRVCGRCPNCGSEKVTVTVSRYLRIVVDGPTYCKFHCRACGHVWKILARAGI